jgi:hypothetical protein
MKKGLVVLWLLLLLFAAGTLFWYTDWQYQLPTPVPKDYHTVNPGQLISFNNPLKQNNNKPVFLHFFNPDCPCSRFNMAQFQSLVRKHGRQVNFMVVVMSTKKFTADEIRDKFDLNIPVLFDQALATACGVYSTPQAVIMDKGHHLYYRGNYNSSRYCTDEKTSYAKIALTGLLREQGRLAFSAAALRAYGCSLPGCKN